MRITEQLADGESSGEVIDLSWPLPADTRWEQAAREHQQLSERSDRLAAHAEQALAQPDATSVLRGIGLAILSLKLQMAAEDEMRAYYRWAST